MEINILPLTSENYSEVVRVDHDELPDEATIKWYEELKAIIHHVVILYKK